MFEIIQAGLLSTLQDQGRRGLRHLGIPWSGMMAPAWQMLANVLVGNESNNTAIECFEGGFQGHFQSAARMAIAADSSAIATLTIDGEEKSCLPFRSYDVSAGSTLTIKTTGSLRLAVIALRGLDVPMQLGSTATYIKAALGGLEGRALRSGDELSISDDTSGPLLGYDSTTVPELTTGILHAVPGPQDHHFSSTGLQTFFASDYELTPDVDRMGARLQGSVIEHESPAARDIVSDAILPGSVQVPGNGQPIVLLADAHTAGGYPKIATVASVDLPALALARPGTRFKFKQVTAIEAVQLTRSFDTDLQQALSSPKVISGSVDTAKLLSHNLIDGVTDGFTETQ